ncbi:MAG: Nramp family divalent metal transporter [bacterium]|nr:Nramp family divalent metal transporter [bacterium]
MKRVRILTLIGPAFVTAAVVLGPGSVSTASRMGGDFGYSLIWLMVPVCLFMCCYTAMGARFGAVSEESLLGAVRNKYGSWLAVVLGVCSFTVCAGFQAGNNLGAGTAMETLTSVRMPFWAVGFTAASLAVMFLARRTYKVVEKLMLALVVLMIAAFFGTVLRAGPSVVSILKGLIPSVPAKSFPVMSAMLGTTFSVVAALYQSYLVHEKGWRLTEYRTGIRDAIAGIVVLLSITTVIVLTSAAVIHPKGLSVQTAGDMARQLEPLLGGSAKVLFCLGLWAAAFSSFIVNSLIGGGLLADGLGFGREMSGLPAKLLAALVMVIGMTVALVFQGTPVNVLIFLQGLTVVFVPGCALVMILVLNSKEIMGEHVNGWAANVIAVAGFLAVCAVAYERLVNLLR